MKRQAANAPSSLGSRPEAASKSVGWQWLKIGDLAETCSGTTPSRGRSDYYGGKIPWVKTGELVDAEIYDTEEHITEQAVRETSLRLLPKETLLVAMYGQGQTRGRTGLLKTEATTNQACFAILPSDRFEPAFLQLWFCHSYQRLRDQTEGRGGNQPNLNGNVLRQETVPLPPLEEQRRIVVKLREQMAEVERARAAVQAQLDAAQTLPAALLRAIFTSPAAKGWASKRIGDVAWVQSGYAFKSDWFTDDGIRLLRNVNVSQGRTNWDDAAYLPKDRRKEFPDYELSEGDIILSLDRPVVSGGLKLTRLTKADLPALLLQRVGRFVLKDGIESDFLHCFLQTDGFIRKITAHDQSLGVPHVSPKQIEEIELPLPPQSEQRSIAARVELELTAARALFESLETRLAEIELLPATLLRSAFGERS